ncbi:phosphatidylserine decarboxylase [Metschnikowia aff. pulcherrima]|uniref:Phosphatidylserine decarboxylase proenzyme 2 n=1 Tax=Metschnikowia aff. pulcherrima TaxID=2163413 RepID=A0A4P6XCX0_9ASCO|nr:phosphatidylserine decarboxylase [Metschnikowia aff. pulcherrima]
MKIRRKSAPLYLHVNAYRAADLFLPGSRDRQKKVNASLVVQLNSFKKRCKRKLDTSHPSWDETFQIPLRIGDYSDLLVLAVWNRSGGTKTYLGEVRIRVREIFQEGAQAETEPTWHKLYLSLARSGFITGSILLLFKLSTGKQKTALKATDAKLSRELFSPKNANPSLPPKLNVEAPTDPDLSIQNLLLSDQDICASFQAWTDALICPDADVADNVNDQGFYSDLPVSYQFSGASDISDIESIAESRRQPSRNSSSSLVPRTGASLSEEPLIETDTEHLTPQYLPIKESQAMEYSTESDILSDASEYASDGPLYNSDFMAPDSKEHTLRRLRRKKRRPQSKYELRNRNVQGVLFLEIASCSNLPPIKSFTRATFDMDPFVVVTFGKKTFRTSWKRHKLNPIYNERLAFEVLENELNYNIQFSVLDKDHFSFHDQVADVSLPVRELIEIAKEPNLDESLTADDNGSSTSDGVKSFYKEDENKARSPATSTSDLSSTNPAIELAEDGDLVKTRKKKFLRKRTTVLYVDTSLFKTLNLLLQLKDKKMAEKHSSTLKIRARYLTYENLRRDFWRVLLEQYNVEEKSGLLDYIELISFLDTLGCSDSDQIVTQFFENLGRSSWGGDKLTHDEIVDCLEGYVLREQTDPGAKIFEIEKCPICTHKRLSRKDDLDIITHVAICASKDWSIVNKLLVSSFVTPQIASKRWFSKVLIKLTYGKYKLGSNSANILVQDRSTGLVMEEKMSVTVRLGIRLLYKGLDKAKSKRIRSLLRRLSVKQGIKFDHPSLAKDIQAFIQFHKLNLSDCLITDPTQFPTFNEFFYRKLKPGARPLEAPEEDNVAVSPADCRCTTFVTVNDATNLWIKGRNFTVAKLFNGNFADLEKSDLYKPDKCCVGIFRLAPQDYHRFHSPVSGIIGPIKYIEGEYYTVNPMAIRSDLDVYGENVRVVVPIQTSAFGTVVLVAVGAMMVGSTVITVKEGQEVKRGDEIGFFKFGGSTVLLLFEKEKFTFDADLVNNSKQCVETLVRVGQSIGHSPRVPEFKREHIDFSKQPKDFKVDLIRAITGGDVDNKVKLETWESKQIDIEPEEVDLLAQQEEEEFMGLMNLEDSDLDE